MRLRPGRVDLERAGFPCTEVLEAYVERFLYPKSIGLDFDGWTGRSALLRGLK